MIFVLQVILLALGLFVDHQYAKYLPMLLPVIYVFIMGPGAFTGTRNINREQLELALSKNWVNAEELAKYIHKFWVALGGYGVGHDIPASFKKSINRFGPGGRIHRN